MTSSRLLLLASYHPLGTTSWLAGVIDPLVFKAPACLWCLCSDGVRICTVCGRRLWTECMAHHSCSNAVGDVPRGMCELSSLLTLNRDFEVLRPMHVCKTIGCRLGSALSALDGSASHCQQSISRAVTTPVVAEAFVSSNSIACGSYLSSLEQRMHAGKVRRLLTYIRFSLRTPFWGKVILFLLATTTQHNN